MSGPRFSVVVATLLRPSYHALVRSLHRQTLHDFELIARNDPGNEYIARNRGAEQAQGEWLVFADDDSVLRPGHLARLAGIIDRETQLHHNPTAITGGLYGNLWAQGAATVNEPGWWVGANIAVRASAFRLVQGFEETWGLGRVPRGWRADTDLGWRLEDHYPAEALVHDPDLLVDHPGPMQARWDPDVESVFFQRYRSRYIGRFVPVDPRGQQFLLETQDLTPEETERVLSSRRAMRARFPELPVLRQEKER